MLTSHLLSWLLLTPLVGAILIVLTSRGRPAAADAIALLTSLVGLALAVAVWLRYDAAGSPYQLLEQTAAIAPSGVAYVVGADGLTVMTVLVIELVGLLAMLTCWSMGTERPKRQAGLLILHAVMLGAAIALDALLFASCWALLLTSVVVGTATRRSGRWWTVALAAASVVALLAGILLIHRAAADVTGVRSFDMARLQQVALPPGRQVWPFLALLVAFASGTMALTLGAGSPRTRSHPALITTALVVLPAYGWVRLNLAILPQAARTFVSLIAAVALATLLTAAVGAWRAREGIRALTWVALGQVAVIVLGLTVIDPQALGGSLVHAAGAALALAPLAVVLSHAWARSRMLAAACWILTLSAIGVPGLIAVTGAAAIVRGVSHAHQMWALAAAVGILVIAAAVVRAARLPLSGTAAQGVGAPRTGAAIALAFAGVAVLMGIAPAPVRARLQPTMARVITRLDPGYAPAFATVPGCGGGAVPAPSAPAGFTAIAPCDSASPAK